MINQITYVIFALYFLASWKKYAFLISWGSIFINIIFTLHALKSACKTSTFQKILTGEVAAMVSFFIFIQIEKPDIFLYFLPILLSVIGKIYLLME